MYTNVAPSPARYSIEDSFSGLRASIPAHRNWVSLALTCAWLCGWAVGEAQAISNLFHLQFSLFGVVFKPSGTTASVHAGVGLIMLTAIGAVSIKDVIWQLFGREVIGVEAGELIHRLEVMGIGRTQSFAGHQIRHLRAASLSSKPPSGWERVRAGSIAFEYSGRSYRIGSALEQGEAELLIPELLRRLPEGAAEG